MGTPVTPSVHRICHTSSSAVFPLIGRNLLYKDRISFRTQSPGPVGRDSARRNPAACTLDQFGIGENDLIAAVGEFYILS